MVANKVKKPTIVKMSITRALNEAKLLEKKIEKERSTFIVGELYINGKGSKTELTPDDLKKHQLSQINSIEDYIKRLIMIRGIIAAANNVKDVNITLEGKSITTSVVELLVMKKWLQSQYTELREHNDKITRLIAQRDKEISKIEDKANDAVESAMASNKQLGKDAVTAIKESYRKATSIELVTYQEQRDILNRMSQLEVDLSNIDFTLSEYNAKTILSIPA